MEIFKKLFRGPEDSRPNSPIPARYTESLPDLSRQGDRHARSHGIAEEAHTQEVRDRILKEMAREMELSQQGLINKDRSEFLGLVKQCVESSDPVKREGLLQSLKQFVHEHSGDEFILRRGDDILHSFGVSVPRVNTAYTLDSDVPGQGTPLSREQGQ
jgi:hypothetical protein